MISFEEFIENHVEKTEVKTINGMELVFLTCSACSFKRSHKHQMSTYTIGRRVWRQQHFDFVANPSGKTVSEHNEYPIQELNQQQKPEVPKDPQPAEVQKQLFKIPANYKELPEAEQKEFIKGLWLNMVTALKKK
jgi:biotin synthase-related radical SAM superfamily protein